MTEREHQPNTTPLPFTTDRYRERLVQLGRLIEEIDSPRREAIIDCVNEMNVMMMPIVDEHIRNHPEAMSPVLSPEEMLMGPDSRG